MNTAMDISSIARVPSNRAMTSVSRFLRSTSRRPARNTMDRLSSQRSQFDRPLASALMLTWPTTNGSAVNSISHSSMRSVER